MFQLWQQALCVGVLATEAAGVAVPVGWAYCKN